jgi:hypothetical protein
MGGFAAVVIEGKDRTDDLYAEMRFAKGVLSRMTRMQMSSAGDRRAPPMMPNLRRALSQYSGLIGRPIGRLQEACA